MAIPNESVYYYECSNGSFRLSYFIPPQELSRLSQEKRISPDALQDFPDGVDLGCTEADFDEFEKAYDYRMPQDPHALRSAFFAVLSTTHDWENYRGSGFMPAADLERHLEDVDGVLSKERMIQEDLPESMSLDELHKRRRQRAVQETETSKALRDLQVKGIDSKRTLAQQEFSPIQMAEGEDAAEVFTRLQQRRRKGR